MNYCITEFLGIHGSVPSREKHVLFDYFNAFNRREYVKFFIMDNVGTLQKNLAKYLFPNVAIIIDKYHYVRQVYWTYA